MWLCLVVKQRGIASALDGWTVAIICVDVCVHFHNASSQPVIETILNMVGNKKLKAFSIDDRVHFQEILQYCILALFDIRRKFK